MQQAWARSILPLGRISKRGTGAMRSLLYEAAVVMLTRTSYGQNQKPERLKF